MSFDGMTPSPAQPTRAPRSVWSVDAGRLWAGGAAAAVVAALVGAIGVVLVRGVLDLELVRPSGGRLDTGWFVAVCLLLGLLATGLAHLLLRSTPRPLMFFGWIVALLTVLAMLSPFLHDVPLSTQVASALLFAVVGITIGVLVSGVAESARSRRLG
jgi:drug/metabolite transporter (DMT)-like permease